MSGLVLDKRLGLAAQVGTAIAPAVVLWLPVRTVQQVSVGCHPNLLQVGAQDQILEQGRTQG